MENNKESIVQKLDRYAEEGKKYRKQFEEDWTECLRFYEGQHYKNRNPQNRPKNFVFQLVESEVPLLMDPMPSTDIISKDDEKSDQAEVLDAAKKHVYHEQNLFHKDVISMRDMLISGNAWQYVDYDADGEGGEGSVIVTTLDWDQVVIDPACTDIDQFRYVQIKLPMSCEDQKRKWPETADEAQKQPLKDAYKFSSSKYYDENQNVGSYGSANDTSRYESKDMTHVEVWYIKDYSMVEIPDDETQIEITEETAQLMQGINPDVHKWEDHQKHREGHTEQMVFMAAEMLQLPPENVTEDDIKALKENDEQAALLFSIIEDHIKMHDMYIESMDKDEVNKKPKYDNFIREIIKTGQVIHSDGSPAINDGLIPLVPFYCYKGKRIYADGAVKNIIPMQKTINELDEKEFKGLKLNANSGWIADSQSGVDPDTLTDEDGIVVIKEQGTEVQRLPPGQISPQLRDRSMREFETMQRIEGVGEAILGEAPKVATSGIMMRRIQMQALGRIRLKSKMIENAILRRDKLIVSRIIKNWSNERKLRVEDGNGKYRFIKFSPDAVRDLPYDLVLSPGSMAGMDNEAIYESYKELLIAGAIDLKTFLEVTNLPKKQIILDKLAEQQQVEQQLQMGQQAMQENLQLKAQFAPQLLTPEEIQQMQSQ